LCSFSCFVEEGGAHQEHIQDVFERVAFEVRESSWIGFQSGFDLFKHHKQEYRGETLLS